MLEIISQKTPSDPSPLKNSMVKYSFGGGGLQIFCTGMLKVGLDFRISTISIPQKARYCDPSLYQIAAKNTQFAKNRAKFSKIHSILQIGRIGSGTETHPSIYQK